MANHRSALKRVRGTSKKTKYNKDIIVSVRTAIKNLSKFLEAKDKKQAASSLRLVESKIMKAVSKGAIKKETASRKVSRLSKAVKKVSAS